MRVAKFAAAASAVAMLGACGGGGGSGGGNAGGNPPPTPTLAVTLSAPSADVTVAEGETATFGFTASYSGTSSQPIVANVTVGGTRYALEGSPTGSGTSFAVAFKTAALAPGGRTTSTVTFRLCTAADCATVYPGSTQTFTVDLDVQLKDWETFQRDAAHTGYVAVAYRTSDFREAWSIPTSPFAPSRVAARRGSVFYNTSTSSSRAVRTRAIDTATGTVRWEFEHSPATYFSGPSYAGGRVASMIMDLSSTAVPMQILDAGTGSFQRALTYESQFSSGGTPTPFGDNLYFAAGYYGNVVYGADPADGTRLWRTDTTQPGRGYVQQGESIAADTSYVYFFRGGDVVVLDRATGAETRRLANPFFSGFGTSYFGNYDGGPILASGGRIISFTDNRTENQALPLVCFGLSADAPLWKTSATYVGHPALRDDRLFAIRAGSAIVEIIDTATGSIIGPIDLGSDKGTLTSNIVLTGSHLFVASESATYAVDLRQSGYPVVWTAPRGGSLAISPDNHLIVSARSGVFAYKLAP